MLDIKYNIAEDDIKFIKNLNVRNIDDFTCLEGQFEIKIGENSIGYVDEKIKMYNELLIFWFSMLNKSILILEKNNHVIMAIPDRDKKWFVFDRKDDDLVVKLVITKKNLPKELISTAYLQNIDKVFWEEKISYNLLKNMLVKKTNKIINDLEIINPISVKSNLIIKLREILK